MKILYITDLHGVEWKYERVFKLAKSLNISTVINGGDLLPIRPSFFIQEDFIIKFLTTHLNLYESNRIDYLFISGNDDLTIHDDLLNKLSLKYKYIHNISQKLYEIENYEFIGFNLITDLPIGIKDRARRDKENFVFPKQIGKQFISTKKGMKKLDDWFDYANNLPTLEKELENLVKPRNIDRAVYVIHMPPAHSSLDVCSDGSQVGSESIYEFIKQNQPILTLHGHIHESPDISEKWVHEIGNTVSIQPGQTSYNDDFLIYCIITLENMQYQRFKVKKT